MGNGNTKKRVAGCVWLVTSVIRAEPESRPWSLHSSWLVCYWASTSSISSAHIREIHALVVLCVLEVVTKVKYKINWKMNNEMLRALAPIGCKICYRIKSRKILCVPELSIFLVIFFKAKVYFSCCSINSGSNALQG